MTSSNHDSKSRTAPWFNVPTDPIMSVEHPCIVRNKMKGIEMLGGSRAIVQSLNEGTEKTLPLFFKPQDPSTRSVLSLHNDTNNILLKVTVPRRTGRKRKRGSSESFTGDTTASEPKQTATRLLRSMTDNLEDDIVEPIGRIATTHIWRNIPDLVYSTRGSAFMKNVESHLLPHDFPSLKKFSLPQTYGLEDTDVVPPPILSSQSLAQQYIYHQNPAIMTISDPITGTTKTHMRASVIKTYTHQWQFDEPVPTGPIEGCQPLEEQPPAMQEVVENMRKLFEERPIWTRRALHNRLPQKDSVFLARYALAYVAYTVRSGPWRDGLIKFGIDPRTDRKYRIYQNILLQSMVRYNPSAADKHTITRPWTRGDNPESHIFDGIKPVPKDGNVWQLCDLEDKHLKPLVECPESGQRKECEIRYFGWYKNATIAKLRILLKAKVDSLIDDKPLDPREIELFLSLPDEYDKAAAEPTAYLPAGLSRKPYEWAGAYRTICGTMDGTVPTYGVTGKARISKPKLKARPSFIDPGLGGYVGNEATEDIDADEEATMSRDVQDEPGGDDGEEEGEDDAVDEYAEPVEGENEGEDEDAEDAGILLEDNVEA